MHLLELPCSRNVTATEDMSVAASETVGVVDVDDVEDAEDKQDAEDTEDAEDMEDAVAVVEVVELETATELSAPIVTLTAILQMHADSGNALRREEKTEITSASTASVGTRAMPKLIAYPTNLQTRDGQCRQPLVHQPSLRLETVIPSDYLVVPSPPWLWSWSLFPECYTLCTMTAAAFQCSKNSHFLQ